MPPGRGTEKDPVDWLATWREFGPNRPGRKPKPEAQRAMPQPRAQPWDGTRPPGGGLKVRVRLPLQGMGNVGRRIPRAAPWAEIGRAGRRSRAAAGGADLGERPPHSVPFETVEIHLWAWREVMHEILGPHPVSDEVHAMRLKPIADLHMPHICRRDFRLIGADQDFPHSCRRWHLDTKCAGRATGQRCGQRQGPVLCMQRMIRVICR